MEEQQFLQRIQSFKQSQAELEENAKKFKEAINKDYAFLDQQLSKLKKQRKEAKDLKEGLNTSIPKEKQGSVRKELQEVSRSVDNLCGALVPRTGSLFVRLFLGRVNVKQYREGERIRLKNEYQKFKR